MQKKNTHTDSWIDCKGNRNTISNNVGMFSLLDGFQVHDQRRVMTTYQASIHKSGCDNLFENNVCSSLGAKGVCVQLKSVTSCVNRNINNVIVS